MHPLLSTILTFVLTFATLKGAVDAVDLSIKPSGEEFTKAVGMSMVLTCEVVGVQPGGPHKVEWRDKEGKPISENIRQRVYTEKEDAGTKLYITNIEHKDAGRYTCHLVGTPTKLFKGIRLAIFKDITFDNAPSPQNPKIFSDAIIHCRVSAEPRPEVSWRFKNRKIEPDMRYSMDVNGLRIKNVTRADDGEYTCRAEVKAEGRYDERRITVAIHIPPTIKKHLESQEGVQGSSIQISCQGDGFPTPKYEFRKNGNSNWLPADHSRIIIDGDVGRIEFKPLRKEDEGEYTCIAINDVGEDRSQAKIAVLVQPEIYELRNLSKTEGESATLVCKSHGDPSPSMTFRKIGSSHDFNSTNVDRNRLQLRYSVGKLELEFKKVNASDTGNYSCTSQNKAGHTSAVGSVVVNYKPRFSHDHVRKVYIWAGKTHNISCHVHAHPLPDIHWLRHGRELQNNDTYQIFTMSSHSFLQVRVKESDQSWIYGNYTCRARNHLGEQRIDIEMAQATIPSAPLSVSVKEVSPNMVILDVVPPRQNGGKEVIGYRIEYGHRLMDFAIGYKESRAELTSTPSTRPSASPSKEELVVENLRPSTNYTFLIRAKNEVGVGHAVQQTVATLPVRTPYPVRIVSPRTGREAFSYTLVWDTPKTGGKPIQKYIIKYRQVDPVSGTKTSSGAVARDDWHSTITISDSMHEPRVEYVLEGLTPMTHYEVEIIAQTNLGPSLPSKFVFSTSEAGPEAYRVRIAMATPTVVGIVIGILLVIIIVVDVSCYFLSGCGLTMFICVRLCDRQPVDEDVEKDKEASGADGGGDNGGGGNNVEMVCGGGGSNVAAHSSSPSRRHPECAELVEECEIDDIHEPMEGRPLLISDHSATAKDSVKKSPATREQHQQQKEEQCNDEKQALMAEELEADEPKPDFRPVEEYIEDSHKEDKNGRELDQGEEVGETVMERQNKDSANIEDNCREVGGRLELIRDGENQGIENGQDIQEVTEQSRNGIGEEKEEEEEAEVAVRKSGHSSPQEVEDFQLVGQTADTREIGHTVEETGEIELLGQNGENRPIALDTEETEPTAETDRNSIHDAEMGEVVPHGEMEPNDFENLDRRDGSEVHEQGSPEQVGDSGKDSPIQLEDSGKNTPTDRNGDSGKNSPLLSDQDDGPGQIMVTQEQLVSNDDINIADKTNEDNSVEDIEGQTMID